MTNPPILALAVAPWHGRRLGRQHILSALARRGWQVTYTTGALSMWDRNKPEFRQANWRHCNQIHEGVTVNYPGLIFPRWQSRPSWDRFAIRQHARFLQRTATQGRPSTDVIAYVFDPEFLPYVEALRPRWVIYHAYDDFSLVPGWTKELADQEAALLQRADLRIVASRPMADHYPAVFHSSVRILPNGIDSNFFLGAPKNCPPDLAAIPRPRIASIGAVNSKLNLDVLKGVADARPDWHLVIVGQSYLSSKPEDITLERSCEIWNNLIKLPNVHYLGARPYDSIPSYVYHCDIHLLCYRMETGWWMNCSPLKLYDALIFGKPVVSTPITAVLAHRDVLALAETPEQWIAAIEQALDKGGVGTPQARTSLAQSNSWESRVDQLENWIKEILS